MLGLTVDEETSIELLQEHHAEELFRVVDTNRAYLRQWLPWLDGSRSAEDTRAFIRMSLQQLAGHNGFAGALRHQGHLVGGLGLHNIDWANRASSIGYWIAEQAQGRGLVTRACAVLLDQLFGELGLHRAEIVCATGNRRSCAVPERLGFTREGIRRESEWLYDHYVDLVVYSMLATEWKAQPRRARSVTTKDTKVFTTKDTKSTKVGRARRNQLPFFFVPFSLRVLRVLRGENLRVLRGGSDVRAPSPIRRSSAC